MSSQSVPRIFKIFFQTGDINMLIDMLDMLYF